MKTKRKQLLLGFLLVMGASLVGISLPFLNVEQQVAYADNNDCLIAGPSAQTDAWCQAFHGPTAVCCDGGCQNAYYGPCPQGESMDPCTGTCA